MDRALVDSSDLWGGYATDSDDREEETDGESDRKRNTGWGGAGGGRNQANGATAENEDWGYFSSFYCQSQMPLVAVTTCK